MRTSLNKVKRIDQYLFNLLPGEETLLMEAELLLNKELLEEVEWQKKTYAAVRDYGRKQLKKELSEIFEILEKAPEHRGFIDRVYQLFKK